MDTRPRPGPDRRVVERLVARRGQPRPQRGGRARVPRVRDAVVVGRLRARPVAALRRAVGGDRTSHRGVGDREHVGGRPRRRGAGRRRPRGPLRRPLPLRHRRQPLRGRPGLLPALQPHGRVSRCARRPGAPRPTRATGPRRPRPPHARARGDTGRGCAPLLRPGRAHRVRPGSAGDGARSSRPRWRSSWKPTGRPRWNSPAATPASTCRCPTTRTTCAASATPTTTSTGAGATD